MTVSALDQLIAEGANEGIVEGEMKGLRKAVLIVLRERFKPINVPKKIKSAIEQINDPIALEALIYHTLDCQTFNEFAESLD
jgi:hypothetical protein